MEGEYANKLENWEAEYRLNRGELTVSATLQSVRSPVQHFARQKPLVLFVVPEEFRPESTITQKVEAHHVLIDGKPDPTRTDPQLFHVSIDTEGQVRYVDDSHVEGVGYLSYKASMVWPVAGALPQVCQPGPRIQSLLLDAIVAASKTA